LFSCIIESLRCAVCEIIVLRVSGQVDLCYVPIRQAALDAGLDQHPVYLVVDLARMPFCSARGFDLLTQTAHTAAERTTGYAVSGVRSQIARVWTLCWDDDHLPVRYRSTVAAITAIRAAESDVRLYRGMPLATTRLDRKTSRPGPRDGDPPPFVSGTGPSQMFIHMRGSKISQPEQTNLGAGNNEADPATAENPPNETRAGDERERRMGRPIPKRESEDWAE
jgi:anti-anti-sigma regulatory factor